ncbi:UNVERIFIED_CONTAM: hypothetical protein PYX00_009089 [Menopon gallinae]|uniref:Reverse transcriptase domain-containing protein n=1 Tax=Menopon gallinae TaxID=328185 RepID=A0AAW2H9Y3_9NEOP
MGSPLSPAIANFFMEYLEKTALESAPLKPSHWFRYVDDTFVIWPHGSETLPDFLNHLNSIHPDIQFTLELESEGTLPFLDVLITRHPDGKLTHAVYRKPTHTDRYLHALSNHHPAQKRAVISTLVHRSKTLSGPDTLASELKHLAHALSANGYHHKLFREALHPKTPTPPQDKPHHDNPSGRILLPFIPGTTDRIGKILRKANINTIYTPTTKISQLLRNPKDPLDPKRTPTPPQDKPHHDNPSGRILLPFIPGTTDRIGKILRKANINTIYTPTTKISQLLRNPKDPLDPKRFPGIYSIPCQCTKVYIGMTQRPIATRITEHERHLRLGHTDQSAVAEHSIQCDHNILFNQTQVKARISQPRLLPFREAIEIAKTPNNFNRDQGHPINPIWLPLLLPPTQTS